MRPTPIPKEEVWSGGTRVVIGPPGNDLDSDIAPVEVLADFGPTTGLPRLSTRCVLEDGDIDALAAGGTVWVTFYGGSLLPFSVDVQSPRAAKPNLRMEVTFRDDNAPDFRAFMGGVPDGMTPVEFVEGCVEALQAMAAAWRAEEATT